MKCPICKTPMKKEKREFQKGIFALVEVCPKCEDEWIDEKGYKENRRKPRNPHTQKDCKRYRLERRRQGKAGRLKFTEIKNMLKIDDATKLSFHQLLSYKML